MNIKGLEIEIQKMVIDNEVDLKEISIENIIKIIKGNLLIESEEKLIYKLEKNRNGK